ncbi:hypothetical protein HX865_03875 [Marine Group I thaumarchaeote]|uniref:Uncharacterized protein n=1 Tax=Marine Group I thaumarchaeote TaxID=2511932 RepID=A0A7K4N308_9ARCH|nr:hypothetical protein [Marine Group I thaumarchaeote]
MALPMDGDFVPDDENSERAPNVDSYRITCIDFIKDISQDYIAWVDRYELPEEEDKKRRTEIDAVIERTNEWIAKVPQTFKAVDVVMNDGLQKMAEATAGKPFQIGVFVDKKSGYTLAKPGIIDVNIKATGRENNKAKLGVHAKDQRFRIESTGKAYFDESNIPKDEYDLLDINLKLNAEECKQRDVISFTVIVSEMKDGMEIDRRGVSTVIHIV